MLPPPELRCPYCFEPAVVPVDRETEGVMVEVCAACRKPWRVTVQRDDFGEAIITLERSQP